MLLDFSFTEHWTVALFHKLIKVCDCSKQNSFTSLSHHVCPAVSNNWSNMQNYRS